MARHRKDEYRPSSAMDDFKMEVSVQRVRCGYNSQAAIGREIGATQCTVSNWLRNPGIMQLCDFQKLVRMLKIDPGVLLRLFYSQAEIEKFQRRINQ